MSSSPHLVLSLWLMMVAQVYGGSISFVVGAYLSSGSGAPSYCQAGGTVVSGLSMVFNNIAISGSKAATLSIVGVSQSPNHSYLNARNCTFGFIHPNWTQVLQLAPT